MTGINTNSAMGGKRRPTLGFFVSELENPYTQTLCKGITDAAAAADANVIIFPGKSPKVPYNYRYQYNSIYKLANSDTVDALILATGTMVNFLSDEEFKEFYGRYSAIPLVSISIEIEGVSSILIDNKVGLRDVFEHFIADHGYDRIAFINGPESNVEAQERFSVYRAALEAHGLPFDPALVAPGDFTKFAGVRAVAELLDNRKVSFRALAAANDEMALSAMEELRKRGCRIPQDVAIAGFDDVESACYASPPLTTVAQPIYEQAYKAVEIACELIKGEKARNVTLPTSMVLRESCGCQPSASADANDPAARLDLLEAYFRNDRKRWDIFHRDIVGLRDVLSLLISDVTNTRGALRSIVPNLKEMGMPRLYVFLHRDAERHEISTDWDFPRKVTLAIAADERSRRGADRIGAAMHVEAILDKELYLGDERHTLVVSALFFMNEHLGFIVCEPNFDDIYIFESLTVEISCSLKLMNLVQTRQKIERQLQTALDELEKYNEQLSSISETDELTQLLNRRGFMNHASHAYSMAHRLKKGGLLFFADLDGLKGINDNYGHEEGDNAIKVAASALRQAFRESDVIARLGGDEFTVFTINTHANAGMIEKFEKRVSAYVEEYNRKSGKPYRVSVSMGMVSYSYDDGNDLETLMNMADVELYRQKKAKKSRS